MYNAMSVIIEEEDIFTLPRWLRGRGDSSAQDAAQSTQVATCEASPSEKASRESEIPIASEMKEETRSSTTATSNPSPLPTCLQAMASDECDEIAAVRMAAETLSRARPESTPSAQALSLARTLTSEWRWQPVATGGRDERSSPPEWTDSIIALASPTGIRCVIDMAFRSKFKIARPTRAYQLILDGVSEVFVGTKEELVQEIVWLEGAMVRSFAACGMSPAPWRTAGGLLRLYRRFLEVPTSSERWVGAETWDADLDQFTSVILSHCSTRRLGEPSTYDQYRPSATACAVPHSTPEDDATEKEDGEDYFCISSESGTGAAPSEDSSDPPSGLSSLDFSNALSHTSESPSCSKCQPQMSSVKRRLQSLTSLLRTRPASRRLQ
eukprot:NODE_1222_length_1630_cov_12.386464_g1087_i0.p1 GENE.NODE_1222_length_1630_cov_12.386464_g1087_i0~~NODE_1222_length_1630_cov_12.386464_g1087_i0.p1  ORF type:complete len:382 (+),score=42.44 NODE_1222_length_1630_cov_12.386464_g1087_i0:148-1293(+)